MLPSAHPGPSHASLIKHSHLPSPRSAIADLPAPAYTSSLNGAAPDSLDFAEFGMDSLSGGLFQDMLQEQPSLDWLEWDLPMPTFEGM